MRAGGAGAAWGRLLRLSLSATAIGDVLAGAALAGTSWAQGGELALLVLASLAVYHGGMALNDWCDREHDRRTRPERPLPAGQISPGAALGVALALLIGGPLCAWAVEPAAAVGLGALALCAAGYDLKGRGPWLGPLLLGTCRALNLGVPMFVLGAARLSPAAWSAPLAYGLYVFLLSRLGRLEDGEGRARHSATPRRLLYSLAVIFWCLPWLPLDVGDPRARGAALCLCLAASWGLVGEGRRLQHWQPADLVRPMGCALRRMLPFGASLACLAATPFGYSSALLILFLMPLSFRLRKVSPPS